MFSNKKNTIIVEKKQKFSKSILWKNQKKFFNDQGVNAWKGQVPYYITSNPFIANAYATMTMRFIQDLVKSNNYDKNAPFYLLELGTGSGKFSFLTVKRIQALKKSFGLESIEIIFIMSDFTENNVNFWKSQPQIQSLIKENWVDFACYDAELSESIDLMISKKSLTRDTLKNPLIMFANYFFDSIPHDVFHFNNKITHEALTHVSTTKDNIKHFKTPIKMEKLDINFKHKAIPNASYYQNATANQVLNFYQNNLEKTSITFPIAGIELIEKIRQLTKNKFLMIASDKAYSHLSELERLKDPQISIHGNCFSMMVNFDAIGRYVEYHGGEFMSQTPRRGIKTCAFLVGYKLKNLPEACLAFDEFIERFSVSDFFNLHENMKKNITNCEIRTLLAHMHFTHWDPHIFRFFLKHLNKKIPQEASIIQRGFIQEAHKLMDNFYFMPSGQDTPFEVGLFFHNLKIYNKALLYYNLSKKYFGNTFHMLFNQALCFYMTDAFEDALIAFKKALIENPSSQETDEWIKRIEEEIQNLS